MDQFCGLINNQSSSWKLYDQDTNLIKEFTNNKFFREYISYAPQNTILFEASLRENILLNSNNISLAKKNKKIIEYLVNLKLEHLLKRDNGLDQKLNMSISSFQGVKFKD